VVRRDGGRIEVAKPPEGPALGVMAGRTNERVGDPVSAENGIRRRQGAVGSPFCGKVGVPGTISRRFVRTDPSGGFP